MKKGAGFILGGVIILALALYLGYVSTGFSNFQGWVSFLWVLLISSGIVFIVWKLVGSEKPPLWLLTLVLVGGLLRLGVGCLWSVYLPVFGHGTPAEQGGYVMGDAAGRDKAAWKLARSDQPLWNAFTDHRKVDQYGGMLFMSAAIYRYLGGENHQPLLIVVLGAACSALAILLTWTFTRRIWGEKVALIAAWGMFLYPEAVLLGSSQMREAFTITLVAAAFYGLARFSQERSKESLAWILTSFLLTLAFSTLTAVMLLGSLFLAALVMIKIGKFTLSQQRWFWLALVGLLIVGLVGVWIALREVTPERITNPIAMLSWWLRKSSSLQAYFSKHASGWMQKIFKQTPEWSHLPMLLAYGVVQPFLPASLVAGSEAPIWQWVAIWRSVGWAFLLVFLVYALFLIFRRGEERNIKRMLTVIVWLVILLAAFRGGGDMWDNPRYRATFACLQLALAAKVTVDASLERDPWLRRMFLVIGTILFWFVPWYLVRYYSLPWPVKDPFQTLGLGVVTGLLLILVDRLCLIKNRNRDLPGEVGN